MNETISNWDDLRLFLAVARSGGLAAAADATGKSPPTLGRRMLELEKNLGQDLFERHPRGYKLTAGGQKLLDDVTRLESQINPLVNLADGSRIQRVKISAGTWVTFYLSQHVKKLIEDNRIVVQFIAADHILDITHREAVVGIRNHRPTQLNLAARRTCKIQFAVYAKSKNINTWAQSLGTTPSAQWTREHACGEPAVEVTHPRNALDMAMAGAVKTVLPTFIGDTASQIKRISEPIEELEHMQWLVTHHQERWTPEVRAVIDWVTDVLGSA